VGLRGARVEVSIAVGLVAGASSGGGFVTRLGSRTPCCGGSHDGVAVPVDSSLTGDSALALQTRSSGRTGCMFGGVFSSSLEVSVMQRIRQYDAE
jgi:hypothetical protein